MDKVKYKNAPISELVLGVTFNNDFISEPIEIGKLVETFSKEFQFVQISGPLTEETITKDGFQLNVSFPPKQKSLYRLLKENEDGTSLLLQLQTNMVFFNWRRNDNAEVGNYPGFSQVFEKFIEIISTIKELKSITNIEGEIKSASLYYLDKIEIIDFSQEEIEKILNIKLPILSNSSIGNFGMSIVSDIKEIMGNMALNIVKILNNNGLEVLQLDIKMNGTLDNQKLGEWFEMAHNKQYEIFENIIHLDLLNKWKD